MSLKTRILQGITVAAAAFAFAGLTSAQQTTPKTDGAQKHERGEGRGFKGHGEFGRGARGGQGGFGMLRGIQLTDAQKEQLRTIHESNKPDEASMQQMRTLMEARRNGTLTDDQKAQLKTLRDQARKKHDAVQQQVLAILTPEQKQQLEARKAEMEKRREEFRQKRQQWKQQKQESAKPTDS